MILPLIIGASLLGGCNGERTNDGTGNTTPPAASVTDNIDSNAQYSAVIERTSYGTAHITANNYGSLGFGQGYAFAQDRFCVLMEQIVKVKGERSRYFGPDSTPGDGSNDFLNIATDLGYKSLQLEDKAPAALETLSADAKAMLYGYVTGYNQYLTDTGAANLPGVCAGEPWVREITANELVAYYFDVAALAGTRNFVAAIGGSAPSRMAQTTGQATTQTTANKTVDKKQANRISTEQIAANIPPITIPKGMASNGIAFGKEKSSTENSLLLSNTHLPWEGELKYHEVHLTIPNELDVAGVSLSGIFGVLIGFNEDIAWTHTTSPSHQFVMYQMALADGDNTKYMYDGQVMDMTEVSVSTLVKAGNDYYTQSGTFYRTHYGPVVRYDQLGLVWNDQIAFSIGDVNGGDLGYLEMFLAKGKAQSTEEVAELYSTVSGVPWNHSMIADNTGKVMYADATMVPNINNVTPIDAFGGLTPLQALQGAIAMNPAASAALDQGLLIADGSTSIFAMVDDPTATKPGIVPFSSAPTLMRNDYVANSNDSFWLTNPDAPIDPTMHSFLYGKSNTPRSYRTRVGLKHIEDHGMLNALALQEMLFSNQSYTEDLYDDWILNYCNTVSMAVNSQGEAVDISQACNILTTWDGSFNIDSVGAVLWRQTLSGMVNNHGLINDDWNGVPFDPANAADTPAELSEAGFNRLITGFADAITFINNTVIADENGNDLFTLDAPLGQVQFAIKDGVKIPLHGGLPDTDGVYNKVESKRYGTGTLNTSILPGSGADVSLDPSTDLSTNGYNINYGASYIMTVTLSEEGPQAQAMLTYSQSEHASSPHFADQTHLYSEKQFRPVPFTREQIESYSNYTMMVISSGE